MSDNDCVFCKIRDGVIPAKKIYENDYVFAIYDIQPAAKIHALVIPKAHRKDVTDLMKDSDSGLILENVYRAVDAIARETGISASGFRVLNNNGVNASQSVFHIHFHVLGGERLKPGVN